MSVQKHRRGARHPDLVPDHVLADLEIGLESANHMEQIAMDMGRLLVSQLPTIGHRADEVRGLGLVGRMRAGGRVLIEELGLDGVLERSDSPSDTVRGWAAMAVGQAPNLSLAERTALMRRFADDHHFAVREWAWLALRAHVAADVRGAIDVLTRLTVEPSDRLRRFATEATRPRGVWSTHLPELKLEPSLGLPVLEPLRADPSPYVQSSVANWLNDAAKTDPDWVRCLCARWTAPGASPATTRISRHALRTVDARI